MKPINEMEYHPISEKVVNILCNKTQNTNPLFFRVLTGFYFSLVASMMRCTIKTHERGDIPVNMYAINLSPSGTGKGFSTNIIEDQIINQFRQRFLENTFPLLAEMNLPKLAVKRASRKGTDPDDEIQKVAKEFDSIGPLLFTFDSGTTAAIKQARHKLLMVNAGSMNLTIDEIGSNLLGNMDVLNTFLELYDVGKIKQKLVKNTSDNLRHEEIFGCTPTNMMLFGTPAKLLNGTKTEEEFFSMLETGYARRCFFGYSRGSTKLQNLTPEQVYEMLVNQTSVDYLEELSNKLAHLADIINMNKSLLMSKETHYAMYDYKLNCEARARELPEHDDIRKAELEHRYFKALKLAGAYAFIDESAELTEKHLEYAIKLTEESGEAFDSLLTRDKNYVKLAKYIANVNRDVTQADLVEDLPFYRGGVSQKAEMMQLAIAYGYQHNIIIKKAFNEGIEFLRGVSLKETNLNELRVSYSTDLAYNYKDDTAPFDMLHKLTQANGMHWITHYVKGGHRNEENCIPGFNLVVIDVDGGINLETAKLLLKDYKALYYTTKRHTDDEHRFRIIFPTSHELYLDSKDYKEFMQNILSWLPFKADEQVTQRSRKWLSHNGHYEYTDGQLLDVLPFIPKTSKNEQRKIQLSQQHNMDNLERWVINNTGDGNRNNQLLKYALILVDAGFDFDSVRKRVIDLNDKLPDKLDENEIMTTIFLTVAKAISKRV